MMQIAVSNYVNVPSFNMATTLHRVAKCIGFLSFRQLLRKDGHIAICFLIPLVVRVPAAMPLFHDISELMMMDKKDMFTEYFQVSPRTKY